MGLPRWTKETSHTSPRVGLLLGLIVTLSFGLVGVLAGSLLLTAGSLLAAVGCVSAFLGVELARTRASMRVARQRIDRLDGTVQELTRDLLAAPTPTDIEVLVTERIRAVEATVAHQLSELGKRLSAETDDLEREMEALHGEVARSVVELRDSRRTLMRAAGRLFETVGGRLQGTPEHATAIARELIDLGDVLDAHTLAQGAQCVDQLGPTHLRRLREGLDDRGYLRDAQAVGELVVRLDSVPEDVDALERIRGDVAVLTGAHLPKTSLGPTPPRSGSARVLVLVGNALPERQSGYTLRTHHSMRALAEQGFEVHVATQLGWPPGESDGGPDVRYLDGVAYHRLGGPRRGTVRLDSWFDQHVQRVDELVRRLEPAVLHAASDFVNARAAQVVGQTTGIPTIYEVRGFWEETWLSRQERRFGWDLEQLAQRHGLPDVYLWRKDIEDRCRRSAAGVVTLSQTMAERIRAAGFDGRDIVVVPNAVDPDEFPVLERNDELASSLGFTPETTVIGCISSLVEYEGVDTLLGAVARLQSGLADVPLGLLIVGDGAVRGNLERLAAELGLHDVVFTKQVPYTQVLDHHSIIDLFVVPRHPADVCHLVTPLKPFEAFATGRTVVMSDVRALADLASDSGAAELFRAGDADSLAEVLESLIRDRPRRRLLALRGAEWVRTRRTWRDNADVYRMLYADLGCVPAGVPGPGHPPTRELSTIRDRLLEQARIPLERIGVRRSSGPRIREEGWRPAPDTIVPIPPTPDWTSLCGGNRNWSFRLHGWEFLEPVLREYADEGRLASLDWCHERALSWCRTFGGGESHRTMAWYDMSVGLRSYRLAYLVEQVLIHRPSGPGIDELVATLDTHRVELLKDQIFHPNNHGVYVALGGLALSRRFPMLDGMGELEDVSRARLARMAAQQFADDGGHVEHSPGYHAMLLETFSNALADGLLDDPDLRRRLELAEDVLGWFVQPNGHLVPVGDSSARNMRGQVSRASAPTTRFHLSGGTEGAPDTRNVLALEQSGFAVVRSPQPTGPRDVGAASYLTLAAGFHSRTHKHADDLALTWFDRGQELLIDAGKYGYGALLPGDSPMRARGHAYAAPERQYVESTRAHNTVEVDGRDHDRRRPPYGSALIAADERRAHYRLVARVDHGSWVHGRTVVLAPDRWLLVIDDVTSADDQVHDFRTWWNLPEEVSLTQAEDRGVCFELVGGAGTLWVRDLSGSNSIDPVRGQSDPLRGWRSKRDLEFTPAWSFGFEVGAARGWRFETLLWLGDDPPERTPHHPFS